MAARNNLAVRPQQTCAPAQRPLLYADLLPPLQGFRRRRRPLPWWLLQLGRFLFVAAAVGQVVGVLWRAG